MTKRASRTTPAGRIFVSRRERRLWGAVAAVVMAVYSTLGIAPVVSDVLRSRGLLEPAFGLGVLLIAAALTLIAWGRGRPTRSEIGVWVGIAAAYFLVLVRVELAEERTHLIEYGLVAALTLQALEERSNAGRMLRRPALLAFLITAGVGTIDELIQALLPNRIFDLRDILFNVLAGVMAVVASSAIDWAREKRPS